MSLDFLTKIALQYWAQLDSPVSRKLAELAKQGNWREVLTTEVTPEGYDCPLTYGRDNAAVCFLKKNPFYGASTAEERKEASIKKWFEGEASCFRTNVMLAPYVVSPGMPGVPAEFLRRVRRRLLGFWGNPPSIEELWKHAAHGPGTTFSSSVRNPTAADKYLEVPSVTHEAASWLSLLNGTMWGEKIASRYATSLDDCVLSTRGNRFTTAPKTALVDRPIAVEASVNIYFQKAVGTAIRERLHRRCGWDLRVAKPVHVRMAQKASQDGSFATIDLSNASDSVCLNLVRFLTDQTEWWTMLNDLRSANTFINKDWHRLEKFSSMGNGYTFELESSIFAAIVAECMYLKGHVPKLGSNLFVFGDDIICPTDCAELAIKTLEWLGFQTNPKKTFTAGPFRESCGGDFFNGHPVRGFYLKGPCNYGSQDIFTLHNGAKRVFEELGINSPWFLDWVRAQLLPTRLRHVGGSNRLGDTVLHGVAETWRWKNCIRWVRTVKWSKPLTVRWEHFDHNTRLACLLTGYGHQFGIDTRGALPVTKLVWVTDS